MDVLDAIAGRRAIRDFDAAPPDRATIERLIDAATRAPSAINRQPWGFAVIGDRQAMARCAKSIKAYVLHHLPPALAQYRSVLANPDYDILHRAPALIIVCATAPDIPPAASSAEDCCLAAQNLMLAAYAAGLGTCWIGFARPWLATPDAKEALGIPQTWVPVAPIVIGTPHAVPPAVERRRSEIVWCRFTDA